MRGFLSGLRSFFSILAIFFISCSFNKHLDTPLFNRDTPESFFRLRKNDIVVSSFDDIYLSRLLGRLNLSAQVYIVRSLRTAAFSFNRPIPTIVISQGFLKLIKSSGEFSFVLCHEAAHLGLVNGEFIKEEVLADRVGLLCLSRAGFALSESLSLLTRLLHQNYFWDTPNSAALITRIQNLQEASDAISPPSYFPDRDYLAFLRRVLTSAQKY